MAKFGVEGWASTPTRREKIGELDLEICELPSKLARQGLGRYMTLIGAKQANTPGQVSKMLLSSMHSEHVEWFAGIFESCTRVIRPMVTDRINGEVAIKFSVDEQWPGSSDLKYQLDWLLGCLHQNYTDFLIEAFGGKKEGTAESPKEAEKKAPASP